MDIRALRYFVEVVHLQSFTAASKALFVTQPTVSKMVKQLEDELASPLLVKGGRQIALTDMGRVVFDRGQEILAMQARLMAELGDVNRVARGELVIGVPPLAGGLLRPIMARFHQKHPQIELKLFEHGSHTVEEGLRAGTLEIGAMLVPSQTEFETLPICNYPLQLIAPADSRWKNKTSVSLGELSGEHFIFYGEGFVLNELVSTACVRAGFTPIISGRSSQWDFMASMVEAGVGIALLPELFGMQLDPARFAVLPMDDPRIWWDMSMAWRRGKYLSFAARAWLDLAREMLAENRASVAGAKQVS